MHALNVKENKHTRKHFKKQALTDVFVHNFISSIQGEPGSM